MFLKRCVLRCFSIEVFEGGCGFRSLADGAAALVRLCAPAVSVEAGLDAADHAALDVLDGCSVAFENGPHAPVLCLHLRHNLILV